MSKREKRTFTSIGGQALIEGIMMRGPQKSAMAVRHTSGEIREKVWDTEGVPKVAKIPVIRGVVNFVISMIVGYRCMMQSVELSGMEEEITETAPEEEKKSPFMTVLMIVSMVLGVGLAVVLFMWLPTLLSGWLRNLFPVLEGDAWFARLFRGGFEGILKIVLFVGYVAVISLMKDIHRVFQYHGAEHKTIFCYEAGLPLTVENVRKQSRFHPRCGTSFMILMLLVGVAVSMLIPADITTWLRTVLKVLSIPLIMGLGYELLKFAGRHDNLFTRIISAPGQWVQRLTTKEPADEMIECAIAAMERVIPHPEAPAAPEAPGEEPAEETVASDGVEA